MSRIAYFYREMSEYIEIDLRSLGLSHTLEVVECATRWPHPVRTWRQVRSADAVMSWFASWHALLPALFARMQGKPVILVVGGYDTACLPGIDYGHQRGGFKSWIARRVMSLATKLVIISEFTRTELHQMRVPDARVALIPLGLDPARYASREWRERDLVITTGGVNRSNLGRKGLESFVRAAALLPELRFVVMGAWMDDAIDMLRSIATPNVTFTGRVSHEDKVRWMARAAVAVQASQHEAFGLSLAESMLCGCAPVVTPAGALPWVAGGTGAVAASQAPQHVAQAIEQALSRGTEAGVQARARVLQEFTVERRARSLQGLLAACGLVAPAIAPKSRSAENQSQEVHEEVAA